jgi:hypothetical protein
MRGAAKIGWRRRSRTISLIASLCAVLSGTASAADGDGTAIEGRWETARKDLVLDISRCAQGYCGRLVTPDNMCERTILTLAIKTDGPLSPAFAGDFAPPNGGRPGYKVRVDVTATAEDKPARMIIIGDVVDPNPMRRSFPYRALLVRVGDPACPARTTS